MIAPGEDRHVVIQRRRKPELSKMLVQVVQLVTLPIKKISIDWHEVSTVIPLMVNNFTYVLVMKSSC